jgi:PAS domain S-box-containing protein
MPLLAKDNAFRSQILDFVEDKLGLGLWVWDYTERRLYWSRGLFRMLQLDQAADSASFETLRRLIHPDDNSAFQHFIHLLDRQFSMDREFRVILRDNRIKWVRKYGELSTTQDGRRRMLGFLVDITLRKEKELDLAYLHERGAILERNTGMCFWNASRDGSWINVPQWTEWTGQSAEDMQNGGWLDYVHPDDRERIIAANEKTRAEGGSIAEDFRIKLRGGHYIEVSVRGAEVKNRLHDASEWTGVMVWRNIERSAKPAPTVSGRQIRAARALLNWTAADLAKVSHISVSSIRRIEDHDGVTQTRDTTIDKIRHAIEAAGVDFIAGNDGDQIIRLRAASEP